MSRGDDGKVVSAIIHMLRNGLRPRGCPGSTPLHPVRAHRNTRQSSYSKRLYRMDHKVEHLLAGCKDWRSIATRYGRCTHALLSNYGS